MATTSEIKVGLDAIAQVIAAQRAVIEKAQQNAAAASGVLGNLPTDWADLISTVQAFPSNGNAFQNVSKAELAALATEYTALKAAADQLVAVAV
jgi:hypothetical protein